MLSLFYSSLYRLASSLIVPISSCFCALFSLQVIAACAVRSASAFIRFCLFLFIHLIVCCLLSLEPSTSINCTTRYSNNSNNNSNDNTRAYKSSRATRARFQFQFLFTLLLSICICCCICICICICFCACAWVFWVAEQLLLPPRFNCLFIKVKLFCSLCLYLVLINCSRPASQIGHFWVLEFNFLSISCRIQFAHMSIFTAACRVKSALALIETIE